MSNDIKSLLDIPEWEKVQDLISAMTQTGIITIDYKGIPVSKHSNRTPFCSVIRGNSVSRKRCQKCDALGGLEAARIKKPFIYLCHCGIVSVAVPIIYDGYYLGAVLFGGARLPSRDIGKVEHLIGEITALKERGDELMAMYNALPEIEHEKLLFEAELINTIVTYIISTRSKIPAEERAEFFSTVHTSSTEFSRDQNFSVSGVAVIDVPLSSRVYPAVKYIHEHINENISMQQMADLCHLSSGYFCRLFSSETGECFSDFVNRTKIERACALLKTTDKSITEIAMELSFQDASYFVKVFKRFIGIPPSKYRKDT